MVDFKPRLLDWIKTCLWYCLDSSKRLNLRLNDFLLEQMDDSLMLLGLLFLEYLRRTLEMGFFDFGRWFLCAFTLHPASSNCLPFIVCVSEWSFLTLDIICASVAHSLFLLQAGTSRRCRWTPRRRTRATRAERTP